MRESPESQNFRDPVLVDLASGEMIETGMIGRDSVVGASAAIDDDIALNRAVVQVAGAASVEDLGTFRRLALQSHTFRATLARHRQFILAQAQQSEIRPGHSDCTVVD
jgi:hypothetical protein